MIALMLDAGLVEILYIVFRRMDSSIPVQAECIAGIAGKLEGSSKIRLCGRQ